VSGFGRGETVAAACISTSVDRESTEGAAVRFWQSSSEMHPVASNEIANDVQVARVTVARPNIRTFPYLRVGSKAEALQLNCTA
jgi:hypothetical protein